MNGLVLTGPGPRISHTRGQEPFFPLQAIADLEFLGWILAGWVEGRF